jgi:hypothetical protein
MMCLERIKTAFAISYIINNTQVIQIQNLMCIYVASSMSKTLHTDSRNKSSCILLCVTAYIVSDHTIITPTKCTLLLLKAPDITICTFSSYILPLHVSTRVGHFQGAQCQCLAKVIINYNLLKLR